MFKKSALLMAALMGVVLLSGAPLQSAEWPTFRGNFRRTAHSSETGLLKSWPEDGPELVWTGTGVGRGYASLAIAQGKVFTLGDHLSGADDEDEYLICLDQASGEMLWKTKTGPAWDEGAPDWQGSRSTPTVNGDLVYVITPYGKLICTTTAGEERWQHDLREDFQGDKADGWGYSESVLIDGEKLVCTPGGPENTMVALDKRTGSKIWSAARPDDRGAGHASIAITEVGGRRVYVQTTGSGPMGVDAASGELLWTYDLPERVTAVIPSPVVRDDLVFYCAGYSSGGSGGALLRQVPSQDGVTIEEVYGIELRLKNKHGGVVLVGDYLYADSDASGTPYCAELMTGDIVWKERNASGRRSASIIVAEGYLYIHFANGVVALVKASPETYEESGSFTLPGSDERPHWAHPAISDGKLYLRATDRVYCYDIAQ